MAGNQGQTDSQGVDVAGIVVTALQSLGLPIAQGIYQGGADTFITFNLSAMPDAFADDCAQADVWGIQAHLFAPFTQNTTALRRNIRNALSNAGCTYPDQTDASENKRSSDGTEQHIVFTCEYATGV